MRCSSCEMLLDQYIEGWLGARRSAAVAAHLGACSQCEALHRRLRNVDGLLTTATRPQLEQRFTDDLMQHVAALPVPKRISRPLLPAAVVYLVTAWLVAIVALTTWHGAAASAGANLRSLAGALDALGESVRAFGPAQPIALLAVTVILLIDVVLFAALAVFYRRVRPRLKAHLTAAEIR